ncbi:hypothetical protein ACXYMO_03850 [Arenibacterium sp. CAU 1754]
MGRGLSAEAVLAAWEAGVRRGPLDRALTLLWAGGQGEVAADLPLSERDRRLLDLRAATFGPGLDCMATCPECGAEVELSLDAGMLAGALAAPNGSAVRVGGRDIALRPLTSRDLAAAQGVEAEALPGFLRARLAPDSGTLAETDTKALDAEIEAQAAAAEALCRLFCPDCGADWREAFDIAAHFWSEVEAAAYRTLGEVAELARTYGWSEPEILALSPVRRSVYLRLARDGT